MNYTYKVFGRPCIPVNEDKSPACQWGNYQHGINAGQLTRLFGRQSHGIAVITGDGLICLDIDNPDLLPAFQSCLPELWHTLRVNTRRGMHLYYRIEAGQGRARRWQGADLLYGNYAILPPTPGYSFDSRHFGLGPRVSQITGQQLQSIIDHFDRYNPPPPDPAPQGDNRQPHTIESLKQYFRRAASSGVGRNNRLFNTSMLASASGIPLHHAIIELGPVYLAAPAPAGHRPETERQRQQQAVRTISSAYRLQPRFTDRRGPRPLALPNSARERLYQLGLKFIARFYDSMLAGGVHPGQTFTRAQADVIAGGAGVGQWSRRHAYDSLIGRKRVFKHKKVSRTLPKTPPGAESLPDSDSILCNIEGAAKPTKNNRGRPAYVYTMPSPQDLGLLLVIDLLGGDVLDTDSARSVRRYGVAMLRALLGRLAGRQISLKRLSDIYGVHKRTIQRWRRAGRIQAIPHIIKWHITRKNIGQLLPDSGLNNKCWLEVSGRRYPAIRGLALRLLATRAIVLFCRQQANSYTLIELTQAPLPILNSPTRAPAPITRRIDTQQDQPTKNPPAPIVAPAAAPADDSAALARAADAIRRLCDANWQESAGAWWIERGPRGASHSTKLRKPGRFSKPLPDSETEALARDLQLQINVLIENTSGLSRGDRIGLATVRQLVYFDRWRATETFYATVTAMQGGDVRNPAGLWRYLYKQGASKQ